MTNILCLETSSALCSVAVRKGDELFSLQSEIKQNHAESITGIIQSVLKLAGIEINELNAVALSDGPGSYTGLRIGASTAKGICFALEIPLIAISTLKLVANGYLESDPSYEGIVWPMVDARRMEIYHCQFDSTLNQMTEITNDVLDEQFIEKSKVIQAVLCGDGAEKSSQALQLPNKNILPHAKYMCQLAFKAFLKNAFVELDSYQPFYLKQANITQSKTK